MDLIKIFRILVVVNFLAFISHFVFDYETFIVSSVDLSSALEESYRTSLDSSNVIVLIIFIVLAFITGPLLFFFVRWSRELLVGMLAILAIITLINGSKGFYDIISEYQVMASLIEALTHGAILAIAYLTPVKEKFK